MSNQDNFPNLSNNPIEAAIFEVRHLFTNPSFNINELSDFHKLISERYPTINKGYNRNVHVQELPNGKAKAIVSGNEVIELRFISEDKKRSLMITSRVFNLNIPSDYKSWADYYEDFEYLYTRFYDFLRLRLSYVITGASVRFINRFIFNKFENPSEYFNTTIYADEKASPNEVTSYLMRYTSLENNNIQTQVTQGVEPLVENKTPYLFDIDTIYDGNIEIDELQKVFDQLHYVKNKTFFNNLTEQTLNLLK